MRKKAAWGAGLPLEITILTSSLGGGTGTHLRSLISHIEARNCTVHVLSLAAITARQHEKVQIDVVSESAPGMFSPLSLLRAFLAVKRRIHDRPPDILHCYFFWPIVFGRLLKWSGKVKVLVENREDEGFNWGKLFYLLLRVTHSLPDRIICVSKSVSDVVAERERLPPSKTTVINNGIDVKIAAQLNPEEIRAELGLEPDHAVVGMVANFNRAVKGVRYFLDAIPMIARALPNTRFLLLGSGGEERALRLRAQALGVESRLIFAGFKRNIHDYYQVMDVSVLTSLSEGLSITLLESMVHGLPVVATRVGGNSTLIEDGVNGYLVPPADAHAFAGRVIGLLRSPELRTLMGARSQKLVSERFLIEATAASYVRLYGGLTEDQHGSPV